MVVAVSDGGGTFMTACASGGGRRGGEKRREVARNADVAAVRNGRAYSAMGFLLKNFSSFDSLSILSLSLSSFPVEAARMAFDERRLLVLYEQEEDDAQELILCKDVVDDGVANASAPQDVIAMAATKDTAIWQTVDIVLRRTKSTIVA